MQGRRKKGKKPLYAYPLKPQNLILLLKWGGEEGEGRRKRERTETWELSVFLFSWLNADHTKALNGGREEQFSVHLVPGINLNCGVILKHVAFGAVSTCNDDWVCPGWAKFQCHLMLVFMNRQVVLVCKSLKWNRNGERWGRGGSQWINALLKNVLLDVLQQGQSLERRSGKVKNFFFCGERHEMKGKRMGVRAGSRKGEKAIDNREERGGGKNGAPTALWY